MQARTLFLVLLLFAAGVGIGYYVGSHPAALEHVAQKTVQSGKWRAQINIPGSVELPTEDPVIKCTFAKANDFKIGYVSVTHQNLTDRSFAVNYAIFGYDEKGRRISLGTDEFLIGKRETVVRNVYLQSQVSMFGKIGSVFAIQMFPNEK